MLIFSSAMNSFKYGLVSKKIPASLFKTKEMNIVRTQKQRNLCPWFYAYHRILAILYFLAFSWYPWVQFPVLQNKRNTYINQDVEITKRLDRDRLCSQHPISIAGTSALFWLCALQEGLWLPELIPVSHSVIWWFPNITWYPIYWLVFSQATFLLSQFGAFGRDVQPCLECYAFSRFVHIMLKMSAPKTDEHVKRASSALWMKGCTPSLCVDVYKVPFSTFTPEWLFSAWDLLFLSM